MERAKAGLLPEWLKKICVKKSLAQRTGRAAKIKVTGSGTPSQVPLPVTGE
jgi:hypothetical protein